jgi:hypothetical protein
LGATVAGSPLSGSCRLTSIDELLIGMIGCCVARTITLVYRPSGIASKREFLPSPDFIAEALQWHCRGQRFDPVWLHHKIKDLAGNG